MDFSLTPEQQERRKEFESVCKELAKKRPKSWISFESTFNDEECWKFHLICAKEFGKRGWLALGWPKEYGGSGGMMDRMLFAEVMGYYDLPGVDVFGVGMLAPTLIAKGNEYVKKKFLPGIASGEVMWCELWSEPNAGSDLASLSSTAIKKGNEFIVNGQKTWTSNGQHGDWGFGVFKSDPGAKQHHNLSFILMDMKTKGIEVRPLKYINGDHDYNEVYLDDVRVPADQIVGEEGEGWAVVNVLAGFERSNIGSVMESVRSLEETVRYLNGTKRAGVPLSKDPLIRNRLADIACQVEAAKCLAYNVGDLQNRNEMALMDASAVKIFASEMGERYASLMTDIMGPYGQVKHSRWDHGSAEKSYQEFFIATISMGTNEIQRNIIAWYGLGLPRIEKMLARK